jgi:hypothetical protein
LVVVTQAQLRERLVLLELRILEVVAVAGQIIRKPQAAMVALELSSFATQAHLMMLQA